VPPALLDRYLARTGYDPQQTGDREPAGQPDNLWQPLDDAPGTDHGAHDEFDQKAHPGVCDGADSGGANFTRLSHRQRDLDLVCRASDGLASWSGRLPPDGIPAWREERPGEPAA